LPVPPGRHIEGGLDRGGSSVGKRRADQARAGEGVGVLGRLPMSPGHQQAGRPSSGGRKGIVRRRRGRRWRRLAGLGRWFHGPAHGRNVHPVAGCGTLLARKGRSARVLGRARWHKTTDRPSTTAQLEPIRGRAPFWAARSTLRWEGDRTRATKLLEHFWGRYVRGAPPTGHTRPGEARHHGSAGGKHPPTRLRSRGAEPVGGEKRRRRWTTSGRRFRLETSPGSEGHGGPF